MTVVATAGHVDHGKSSLVKALTGVDPDRFEEEKRRGLTIDIGFGNVTLASGAVLSLVDVPGHVRFLRNMLAGVGAVDAALFVVAATEGWKPQSEEHLRILDVLGVGHGVIAMTKSDLVDEEWRELQAMEIADRVRGSFLDGAPIVALSSVTGAGLDDLHVALEELLRRVPPTADRRRPRLWVDRVFAAKGSGTVVTGTLTGGSVEVEQHLDVVPGGQSVRIRGLQVHGRPASRAAAGTRVAINVGGIDHHQLSRGDALVVAAQWRPTVRFDASLGVLAALDHQVSRRGAYLAYIGSGEFPVRLRVLGAPSSSPGTTGLVRIHLATPVPLVAGDRFVLRESGRDETVGGGEVLDVAPSRPASKARPDRSVERMIAERGWVDAADLAAWTGEERSATVGRWVVDPAQLAAARDELLRRIGEAGAAGLDVAVLGERDRAVLGELDGVVVDNGRVRAMAVADPFADHPLLDLLRAGGAAPPDPVGISKPDLRELVRRALVVERDGIYWHPQAIDAAAQAAARLLAADAGGFTMSQFREALGVSRKYAVPLASELDARGVTRRRDDLRIAGPRLPALP